MKSSLTILDDICVASPCTVAWEGMLGDDRRRHCVQCDQAVYDLSALTKAEAVELVTGSRKVCVRLYRRPDGRVITRDCLAGRLLQVRRKVRRAALAVASFFGVTWTTGCGQVVQGDLCPPPASPAGTASPTSAAQPLSQSPAQKQPYVLMGGVSAEALMPTPRPVERKP